MKALLMTGYGPLTDKLKFAEITVPHVGPNDVLIEVHAASLNPIDYKIVQGGLKRIEKRRFPSALGFDVSGVVLAVGNNVSRFKISDEVYARAPRERIGTFAEQTAIDERYVAIKPQGFSHLEAASIPLVGLTTVQALVDRAQAKRGQSVLIHAGSGGVGTFAIQYAKVLGLQVTTTASSKNAAWVQALGAEEVICYDRENYLDRGATYDIVYDTLGQNYTTDAFKVVKHGGVVVSIAGGPDKQLAAQVNAGWFLRLAMNLMSRHVYELAERAGAAYHRFLTTSNGAQLADLAALIAAGKIKAVIDTVYPFAQIIEAMTYAAAGRVKGKVVVQMK